MDVKGFPDDYIIDHDYTGKTYPERTGATMRQCSMPTDTCGTGQSKFARIVCCRADAEYADRSRADRTAPVCVNLKFCGGAAMIQTAEDEEKQ